MESLTGFWLLQFQTKPLLIQAHADGNDLFSVSCYMNLIVNKILLSFQQGLESAFASEMVCPPQPDEFGLAEASQLIKTCRT